MKTGFIGLGIMGSRMAANLQKHGTELIVYNRTREKANELVAQGAQWAESPIELARQVKLLFTMLSTPDAVRETALGSNGFLNGLKPGSLWVDCSTVNPSFSGEMAAEAQQRQVRFMDAPVAGSRLPAEKGELIILAGGDDADFRECEPMLEAMGKTVLHVGGVGKGASFKMVNNLLMGVAMLAFSEALALGQSLGLEQEQLFKVLLSGTVAAPFLATKKDKLMTGKFTPDFPLEWMQKDMHLATVSAYENGVSMPLTNVTKEMYMLAERMGMARQDFSAVYRVVAKSPQPDDGKKE